MVSQINKIIVLLLLAVPAIAQETTTEVEPIITESTVTSKTTTTLNSPPPSAISPTINTSNSDLCTFGVAGAIQTQILGISTGTQITDDNCEMLKNAKTLYDQDQRVFDAMMNAGTPCPYNGMIGDEARAAWETHEEVEPANLEEEKESFTNDEKTLMGSGAIFGLLVLLLL